MLFPLVNKINFLKYQGYTNIYFCIVLASDLFRFLSGNEWIRSNIWTHRNSKDYQELLENLQRNQHRMQHFSLNCIYDNLNILLDANNVYCIYKLRGLVKQSKVNCKPYSPKLFRWSSSGYCGKIEVKYISYPNIKVVLQQYTSNKSVSNHS